MTPARRHAGNAVAVLAAIGVLAGCAAPAASGGAGSTAGPVATSAGGPAGGATPPAGTSTGGSPGAGTAIDACALLSDADIKEITGFEVARTIPDPADTTFAAGCQWLVVDAAWQIHFGITSPGGQATWDSLVPYLAGKKVDGIGDEAFLAELGGDLMVRRGDTVIDMQWVAAGPGDDVQEALAKRVLEHLP